LTPEQITLVQTSFALVAPISDTAATLFYNRLFELDPSLRKLFAEDLREQRLKLMAMLATAVNSLHRWAEISPQVKKLGQRHIDYGVKPNDYATVRAALLDTLEKGLGDAFTPPVRQAWTACYQAIATDMQEAPDQAQATKS
jgi:hemoglobin-like flavoprotein